MYANFCGVAHTPFDFTLTFCEVMPLSEKEIREAEADHIVRAPVKARIVMPVQFVPTLIAALQENLRIFSESHAPQPQPAARQGPRSLRVSRSVKSREVARRIFDALERHYPDADTELHLSQRRSSCWWRRSCRRSRPTQRVNLVTPELFRRYPGRPRAGRGRASRRSSR